MLNVDSINVFYEDLQALWDVSFSVDEGTLVAIVGSNGAGKTTTLQTVSGLLQPASGTIELLGNKIDDLSPHQILQRGISHVPEGRRLFPHLTVLENLEIGAYTSKARKKADDTMEWMFQLFPILKERRKQLAETLSGGEQQMLAIARGLMSRPKLLTLDEPSLGLAPYLVEEVFQTLEELNNQGVTILLVEQNVFSALELAHNAYVLETGRIILEGDGEKLLENDYVKKAFLGI
ncbi:MAG: ABC transporter ATP-binding protein [Candidatus Hodarchaeota archaeon]